MAQILPGESIGGRIGSALGTGIGSGLQNLATMKMKELARRQITQGLQAPTLGFTPAEAQLLSGLDTTSINQILKQQLARPQQEAYAQAINAILGGGQQPTTQQQAEQSVFQPELPPTGAQQYSTLPTTQTQKPLSLKGLTEQQATNLAKLSASERKIKLEEQKAAREEARHKRKEDYLIQKDIDTETHPYYEKVTKEAEGAEQTNKKLTRIEKLINEGNLGIPVINSFLTAFKEGIVGPHGPKLNLDFLKTADAQEIEKLVADFLPEAKDFFPGRITDKDLAAFFARLPELTKSRAGNLRVVQSIRAANQEKILRKELADKIIEENDGRRPRNIDRLVEQRGKEQFDKLYQEFINLPLIPEKFLGGILRY